MHEDTLSILNQTNFTSLDWWIIGGYLMISIVIGLFVTRYIRNMTDYIGAGRSIGTRLGIATLTGTELGLITVMYSAQKGFKGGFAAFHIALLAGVVALFVGITGFIVFRLRQLKVLTIPEYYEQRFGKSVRVLGGIMLAFGGILNMGLFLKVGSMFIVGITGMSASGAALPLVMSGLLLIVLVYTVLGGMVAVVITDYIQFVVLSFSLLLVTGMAIHYLGWTHIVQTVYQAMGEGGFNPLVSEGAFGVEYVLWMLFLGLVNCALWPTAVARALSADRPQTVKRQYRWSSISFLIRFIIPYFWGICAFVFFVTQAPQLESLFFPDSGMVQPVDSLYAMPIFLGRLLPTGLLGLIAAGMIAAFMSTHDSYLLCWSSVITQDIVAPFSRKPLKENFKVRLTRILIVLIGLYVLYWGLIYKGTDDIWDYMAVSGAIYFSGAFALLVGGLYWKKASSAGAFLALLAGLSAILGLGPVQDLLNIQIPSERVGLLSILFTSAVFVLGSLLFPDKRIPAFSKQIKGTD